MRYINSVLSIGIFLILIPLLGFPSAWESLFIVISGLWLCGISFSMRFARSSNTGHKKHSKKIHVSATHLEPIPEIKQPEVYTNNSNEQTPTL